IESYLRQLPYREDTPFTPPGREFVDYFLFDLEAGYCTYFATAMVVLLREIGIPARLVEGYILSLEGPGTYTVTPAEAHTWVEALVADYGWVSFEPTPAYPADPGAVEAGAAGVSSGASPGDAGGGFEDPEFLAPPDLVT